MDSSGSQLSLTAGSPTQPNDSALAETLREIEDSSSVIPVQRSDQSSADDCRGDKLTVAMAITTEVSQATRSANIMR